MKKGKIELDAEKVQRDVDRAVKIARDISVRNESEAARELAQLVLGLLVGGE